MLNSDKKGNVFRDAVHRLYNGVLRFRRVVRFHSISISISYTPVRKVRSLMVVPNLVTWDPYLPKTEETLDIYATG